MTSFAPSHGRGTAAEQGARIREQMGQGGNNDKRSSTLMRNVDEKGWGMTSEEAEKKKRQEEKKRQEKAEKRKQEKAQRSAQQESNNQEKNVAAASPAAAPVQDEKKSSLPSNMKLMYPVSGIDNLALLMESKEYQTTCFSTYLFKTELDSETIHQFFNKLVSCYPKYHYVVELSPSEASKKAKAQKKGTLNKQDSTKVEREGRKTRYSKTLKAGGFYRPARWRYDDQFKVSDNIIEYDSVPGGGDGGDEDLFRIAGEFLSEHFDYTKPLWRALCVRGLNTSKGAKSALMIKVHHSLSDGQGMIMSYHTALAALENDAPIKEIQAKVDMGSKKGQEKKPGQRNVQPTLWGTTKHGFHTFRGLYFRRRKAFEYTSNQRNSERFYCHSDGIPMKDIKFVRDAFSDSGLNLSLNDVACAVLARALRMAAERTEPNGKVQDKRIAVFIPISKRPTGNWELTNFTTGAIAWFSFNDPKNVPFKQQLSQAHREMNRIKKSYWPQIWFNVFGSIAKRRAIYMPNYPIWKQFFEAAFREYSVCTNVPGPSKSVYFGQHEAFSYHVLPPSSPGKGTFAIGMISYADNFSLAVSCDAAPELVKRKLAQEICKSFQDAAKELIEAANEEKKSKEG